MTNIVEGFDSGSSTEFARFLGYARRSASEVQSILYAALDQEYITESVFAASYGQAEKVRRMVTAFIKYLRTRQHANTLTRKLVNA